MDFADAAADAGGNRPDLTMPDMAVDALPAHCGNQVNDEDESDIDCGGAECKACATGRECNAGADCKTGQCHDERCVKAVPSELAFSEAMETAAGLGPVALAAVDLDADGYIDIISANQSGNSVGVHYNQGQMKPGAFVPMVSFPSGGSAPSALAVGDFNKDKKPDVAVANDGMMAFLLNGAHGSLANDTRAGYRDTSSAMAFDGKGGLLATGQALNNIVWIRSIKNYPDWSAPNILEASSWSGISALAWGDLDDDGAADLIAGGRGNDGGLNVFFNAGNGGFGTAVVFAMGKGPIALAVADLDLDGHLDVAVGQGDDTVATYRNLGQGRLVHEKDYSVGAGLSALVVGDFNGDGLPDVATMGKTQIDVLAGIGGGELVAGPTFAAGMSPAGLVAADFDKDGKTDLAVADSSENKIRVFFNQSR